MTDQQYIRPKDIDNRSSFGQRAMWRIEALAWDILYWWPMKALGADRASNLGGWLFKRLSVILSQRKTVLRNLRLAFPELTETEREVIALQAWENVGRTAGELPHLPRIKPFEGDRVEVTGSKHLDKIKSSGKGAVFVSGHLANWEIMAAVISNSSVDCMMTYRMLNNPHIDKRINKLRHDYGTGVLTPKGLGTRELMRALSSGRSVALMNDQKFNQGLSVNFFNHPAMTAPGPSRLALKYDVPIVPVSTRRTGPARFHVTVHEPFTPAKTNDTDADVRRCLEQITGFIEEEVRANPGQWFWQHRRWGKDVWVTEDVMDAPES